MPARGIARQREAMVRAKGVVGNHPSYNRPRFADNTRPLPMAKPKSASLTYLRFLNLAGAVRSLPAFPPLDAVEERALNALAAVWTVGARVTVLQAVQLAPEVSPSTVHRRLKGLQRKGLIALPDDASDSRVRIVEPTALATEWFSRLGQCLSVAAREG